MYNSKLSQLKVNVSVWGSLLKCMHLLENLFLIAQCMKYYLLNNLRVSGCMHVWQQIVTTEGECICLRFTLEMHALTWKFVPNCPVHGILHNLRVSDCMHVWQQVVTTEGECICLRFTLEMHALSILENLFLIAQCMEYYTISEWLWCIILCMHISYKLIVSSAICNLLRRNFVKVMHGHRHEWTDSEDEIMCRSLWHVLCTCSSALLKKLMVR